MTHPFIENVRQSQQSGERFGAYLPSEGETCFRSLDGADVAAWLERNGYSVTDNRDTGRNGLATTACGMQVSTNGYVCIATEEA